MTTRKTKMTNEEMIEHLNAVAYINTGLVMLTNVLKEQGYDVELMTPIMKAADSYVNDIGHLSDNEHIRRCSQAGYVE